MDPFREHIGQIAAELELERSKQPQDRDNDLISHIEQRLDRLALEEQKPELLLLELELEREREHIAAEAAKLAAVTELHSASSKAVSVLGTNPFVSHSWFTVLGVRKWLHHKVHFIEVSSGGYADFRAEISRRFATENFSLYYLFEPDDYDFENRRLIFDNESLDWFNHISYQRRCEKYIMIHCHNSSQHALPNRPPTPPQYRTDCDNSSSSRNFFVQHSTHCVFCGSSDSDWECAYLCPNSLNPDLAPVPPFFEHQPTIDNVFNQVRACPKCHDLFDCGAFYVDADDDFKICKSDNPNIFESILRNDPDCSPSLDIQQLQSHFDHNLKENLQLPASGSLWSEFFPFKGTQFYCIWAWRRQNFDYYASRRSQRVL